MCAKLSERGVNEIYANLIIIAKHMDNSGTTRIHLCEEQIVIINLVNKFWHVNMSISNLS